MKILSVVGTRPNFIKEYLLQRELKKRGVKETVVHTGQHYDYEMSQIFFDGFQIAEPDYHLDLKARTNIQQTASILSAMENILLDEKPTCTLVYGDVNSTSASAIASAKLRIPVIHVEGGVRSNEIFNPEEINRRVTDHLSSLIFACTKTDYEALLQENFPVERIYLSGDLMKDSLLLALEQEGIESHSNGYTLVTIHREENVERPERLREIMRGLIESDQEVLFPIHPRTEQRLESNNLLDCLEKNPRITILKPQSYFDFVRLLAGADRVLTDSGGVRREAYILGKPVIVPINIVWFPEILNCGWMVIVDPPKSSEIAQQLHEFNPISVRPQIFGDGMSHKLIVKRIIEKFG